MSSTAIVESKSGLKSDSNLTFAAGLLLMIAGVVALAVALWTTLATMLVLGGFLVVGGVLQVIGAFMHRRRGRSMVVSLIGGLLCAAVGVLFILFPGLSAVAVTSLLAIYFLAAGLVRLFAGIKRQPEPDESRPDRGWLVLSGIASMLVGVIALWNWPLSSLWLIGTLIGVDLLFAGASLTSAGVFLRSLVAGRAPTRMDVRADERRAEGHLRVDELRPPERGHL